MTPNGDKSSSRQGNCYILVWGTPRPDEPVTLAPGITMLPLPCPLDVFDLAAMGASGFREWAVLEPIVRGCGTEIESALDSATEPGFDSLNRAWLAVTLLVLLGHTGAIGVAVSKYRWQDVPIPEASASWTVPVDPARRRARTNMPPFEGGLLDLHLNMLSVGEPLQYLASSQMEWIRTRFAAANALAVENPSFSLALQSVTDWRFSPDYRSAIARLWSGIEALICVSSELVFRISLIGASLLEERGAQRLARFKSIKKLYGQRSKAVHGDEQSKDQLESATLASFQLLRDLIVLTINRGRLLGEKDFDDAIFN